MLSLRYVWSSSHPSSLIVSLIMISFLYSACVPSKIEKTDEGAEGSSLGLQKRVISLAPSNTEWVFALKAQSLLVARTDQCDRPLGVSSIKSIGGLFPPKFESILAQKPTDVLMIKGHQELKGQLKRFGIRVHTLAPQTLDDVLRDVGFLGKLLDREDDSSRWVEEARMRVSRLKRPLIPPRVLIEVWFSPLTMAGSTSYMADLVRRAGGSTLQGIKGEWPTVHLESLVAFDPEVILVSTRALFDQLQDQDLSLPWSQMSAVKSGAVYFLDGRLSRPGPRVIEELEWLNSTLLRHSK